MGVLDRRMMKGASSVRLRTIRSGIFWCGRRNAKILGAKNVLTGCDSDDELLMVTDKVHNGEVVAHSSGKSFTSVWIQDSICSFHACSNRMEFDTQKEMVARFRWETKQVVMFFGVGTVKINMHDAIVRSLSEVIHVLKLRKNLISHSTLGREWYLYKAKKSS